MPAVIPTGEDHGLRSWRNVPSCDRNVTPHGRWAAYHELCPWGSIGWVTFRGSKHTNLLQLDRLSSALNGSAPKFSKRTILAGLVSFLSGS